MRIYLDELFIDIVIICINVSDLKLAIFIFTFGLFYFDFSNHTEPRF